MTTKPANDTTWIEPDSQNEFSKYPYNHVTQTESGHSFEMDDTPGYERIRLQHRIGNYTEIQSNGDEIHKIKGDGYEIVVKNHHVLIKGYCTVTIQGDSVLNVKGDVYQKIEGDVNQKVEGTMTSVVSGDVNIASEADVNISSGSLIGQVNLNAPFGVHINSDLTVSGTISSTGAIFSAENVMAGKKVYGTQGLSTLAGINCGYPDAGPLVPGVINASIKINVPTVNALVVNDIIGSTMSMRIKYSSHTHPGHVWGPPNRSQMF